MGDQQRIFELFSWITPAFVQKVIDNAEPGKCIELNSFNVEFVNKSDSVEMRRNFLIKIAIQTEEIAMINKECHNYETEIEIYTKILPALEDCFSSIGMMERIAPRCFMADVEKNMLVFEDLRNDQFKIVNRMFGLNMDQLKLTLVTLAKWHAGTATLLLTNKHLFEWSIKGVDYPNATMVKSFYNSVATSISNTIKDWPGYESIAKKLTIIPQYVHERMRDVYGPNENVFNVITHGDMFLNNILFQSDRNGHPVDIRFVDFPLGKHTTPAIDLVCLLFGSANSAITQCDREHLIQYYHGNLVEYLKLLKFPGKIPTLLDIQSAVFRVDYFNALIVLFILGLRFLDKSLEGGFMEAANDCGSNAKMYSHPECIERLKYLLDLFDRRGYLDY